MSVNLSFAGWKKEAEFFREGNRNMIEKEIIERKALLHRQAAKLLHDEARRHEREAGSSPELESYFKIGVSDDYILLRDDFPLESVSPGDFKKLLLSMFKKNDEARKNVK